MKKRIISDLIVLAGMLVVFGAFGAFEQYSTSIKQFLLTLAAGMAVITSGVVAGRGRKHGKD